jgi:hypothetical protein
MKRNNKEIIAYSIVFLLIGAGGSLMFFADDKQRSDTETTESFFEQNNFQIVDAKFNSPEVIIKTDSAWQLVHFAESFNTTTVYKVLGDGYVVVDSDFKYAYNFEETNIGSIPYMLAGVTFLLLSLIWMVVVVLFISLGPEDKKEA